MSSLASNGVAKSVTRVGVQAATAAATDAGLQLCEKGEIDTKQLMLNTVGQVAMASTAEVTQSTIKRTEVYSKTMNEGLVKDNMSKDQDKMTDISKTKQELIAAEKVVNSLPSKDVQDQIRTVDKVNTIQEKIADLKLQKQNSNIQQRTEINKEIKVLKQQAYESMPTRLGENKVHFLHGDRTGQVAVEIKEGPFGTSRVVLEKLGDKYVYVDHTLDHNYEGCRKGVRNFTNDPFRALRPDQINRDFNTEGDEEPKQKTD